MKIKISFIDYQIEKLYDFLLDNLKGESGKIKFILTMTLKQNKRTKQKQPVYIPILLFLVFLLIIEQ